MSSEYTKHVVMVAKAETAGQIYDELGESLCQPVIDACEDREWTGSRADWNLLQETAERLDEKEYEAAVEDGREDADDDCCPECGNPKDGSSETPATEPRESMTDTPLPIFRNRITGEST